MVELENNAWHACAFNRRSIGIEMAGFAAKGFGAPEWQAAANIVAFLLHAHGLPMRWAEKGVGAGFCSHADLGAPGGGHQDPTTDAAVWHNFVLLVQGACAKSIPDSWGPPGSIRLPPGAPTNFTPSLGARADEPEGSLEWIQMRLNASGAYLRVDGLMGSATRSAIAAFQETHHLFVDGVAGPQTIKALAA